MSRVANIRIKALRAPMSEPFEIAGGAQTEINNLLVSLKLSDGTVGFGECAPAPPPMSGESQVPTHRKLIRAANQLEGTQAGAVEPFCRQVAELCDGNGPAGAALEMAFFDAWTRQRRLPLYVYFGGAENRVATDITVPIMPPAQAEKAARKILRRGVSTIKIKVGKDLEEDEARVRAVFRAGPRARLLLDANQGYRPMEAVNLLRRLGRAGIRPVMFEQPVAKNDLDGLAEVGRKGGVPVAADESAATLKDVWELARRKAVSVINIKFMKFGVWEAWQAARAAKAAGLGLMMGGMVESRLAMGCAAHFAAGFGGFDFIDLDTPLWFAKDPMRGPLRIGPAGIYDLARVGSGIGVKPA